MDIYETARRMKEERKTIFDLDLRVTFYARVSSKKDEQENSLENQIMYFSELIKNNPRWTYIDGYVDRIRGEAASNRPNFQRMIDDGKAGAFDLVLTKEVSRFARNTVDGLIVTRELLRSGVGVFFQNDNLCTIDTDAELRLTIMLAIATDEVRKLSERVRWGHKRSIESGKVLGNNRIFGYDKEDGRLVINEPEAEMVRLIFELYSTGQYSSRKIEKILYDKGYRGREGTRIHHNTINGIIQNPKYKGWYCGNKVKVIDHRTREQRFLPEDEWVLYKDETGESVPAIVTEELWERANAIFRERSGEIKSRTRSFKDKSVFTGKIWCRAHDVPYWRTSYSNSVSQHKPVYQWICSEKKRSVARACSSFAIMEDDLYKMLSDHFKLVAGNIEEYVAEFLRIYKETNTEVNTQRQINELKVKLDKEKAKREKLLDLYTEEMISKQEFKSRNDSANVLISQLEEDIHSLEAVAAEKSDYASELAKIEQYFKTMYSPEGDMTREQVDELARTIIDRIDVVPINKNSMKLEIKLKTGLSTDFSYVRAGERYARRSGQITKKMIDSYKQQGRN